MTGVDFLDITRPPQWLAQASCAQVDPELFFPTKRRSTRAAKAVCACCPAQEPCWAYALAHDKRFGIWGATSRPERRRITHQPMRHTSQRAAVVVVEAVELSRSRPAGGR